jgi:hypothetical protein
MHQLVLQFPADTTADYDVVIEVEELLIGGLDDQSEVDGHDFGLGAMNVFIWTHDASRTFASVRELLAHHPLMRTVAAGYREDDADAFTPLWPEGSEHFDVL